LYAYRLHPRQDLQGLSRTPQQPLEPGPGQVVVRMRAASLNRRDLMLMDGTYPLSASPGVIPLSDGVGDVVAVGGRVTRVAVGDRVTSTYFPRWVAGPQRWEHVREQLGASRDGWLASHVLLDEDATVAVPQHLSDVEAAGLPCAGVVAWVAVTSPTAPGPGEAVLTIGTGAVALFALQFARLHGARVISVTSGPARAERLRDLGADVTIDRIQTPDWVQTVLELTGGDGVEHVVDAVGMLTLPKSVACSAFNARITLVGAFPGAGPIPDLFAGRYVSIRRIAVGSRTDFEAMNHAIETHQMRPVVDRVFTFDQAVEAFRHFKEARPFGKVVIEQDRQS
jgi:NADPH:quinone reductase-like Zn-dependent oxidoreductase